MSRGDNVQGILGAIDPFWEKWGWDKSRGARVFSVVIQRTFRQLYNSRFSPNLVTKRSPVSRRGIRKDIFQNFHFRGHFLSKSKSENRSNRHLTQSRLQVTWCTAEIYCLLHVVVQGPMSFRDRSTFLYDVRLRSYEASKLPNFRIFAYFPYTKPLKRTFRWPALYSPGVTSLNDSHFHRATRMHSADYAVARCLSVCPSHAGIDCKRLYISLKNFDRPVAPPF